MELNRGHHNHDLHASCPIVHHWPKDDLGIAMPYEPRRWSRTWEHVSSQIGFVPFALIFGSPEHHCSLLTEDTLKFGRFATQDLDDPEPALLETLAALRNWNSRELVGLVSRGRNWRKLPSISEPKALPQRIVFIGPKSRAVPLTWTPTPTIPLPLGASNRNSRSSH